MVLLRPKMYSIETSEDTTIKRAKGINRSVVRQTLSHSDYYLAYINRKIEPVEQTNIISQHHQVYTLTKRKRGLSVYDDKRAWINKNESRPYGYNSRKRKSSEDIYIINSKSLELDS